MRGKAGGLVFATVVLISSTIPQRQALLAAAPDAVLDAQVDLAAPRMPYLAAGAAAIIAGLLLLLYLYRRRAYILYWTGGWASLAASLACAGASSRAANPGAFLLGVEQFLSLGGALLFVVAADAYRLRP